MGSDPQADAFRRNPAREVEQVAVAMVSAYVSDTGYVIDLSQGNGPDFRIDYRDRRTGFGEVAWHADPVLQEMWSKTHKREGQQRIELPPGLGQWGAMLVRGARIDPLGDGLPQLVQLLHDAGLEKFEIDAYWPRNAPAGLARQLGVQFIFQSNARGPSFVFYSMPGSGGAVPRDPNVIVDWISEMLASSDYSDTTTKLLKIVDCDERHVFVMAGSRTEFGAEERLRRLGEGIPTKDPVVPDGITHVWVVPQFGPREGLRWAVGVPGWEVVPF